MAHHPMGRRLRGIGIVGLVVAILTAILAPYLEPAFELLSIFWLPVAIAITIGLAVWRLPAERLKRLLENRLVSGLAIFVLLLTLYVYLGRLGYTNLSRLAEFMGVSTLVAALILSTTALLLAPLPAIGITLFKPTGIPIDPKLVAWGSRGLAFIIIVILLIRGINVEGWLESTTEETMQATVQQAQPRPTPASQRRSQPAGQLVVLTGPGPVCTSTLVAPGRKVRVTYLGGNMAFRTSNGYEPVHPGATPLYPAPRGARFACPACKPLRPFAFLQTMNGRDLPQTVTEFQGRTVEVWGGSELSRLCLDANVLVEYTERVQGPETGRRIPVVKDGREWVFGSANFRVQL